MCKSSRKGRIAAAIVSLSAVGLISAQGDLSLQEILKKNLEASGGEAMLGKVTNLSFKTAGTRQIVSSVGELKILFGKDPVVTEIIRVREGKVDRRSVNGISEVTGPQKIVYQTLAKLYAGVFSLEKFTGQLKLEGLKSYGPKKFFHLTTTAAEGPVSTHFYLGADDFRLKRLVFQGTSPEGDKYEVNYDFGPFEEAEGLRLPLSWFASQVGAQGDLTEVAEAKANQALAADFFSEMDLNMGAVKAGPGSLEGNVLDVDSFGDALFVTTNWMKKDVEQAGFKNGEELTLRGGDQEKGFTTSIVFYATGGRPPRPGEPGRDVRILGPARWGGSTYVLQMMGPSARDLAPKMTILTPLSVTRTPK